MKCGLYCTIIGCGKCINSPFYKLALDADPFSEVDLYRIPAEDLALHTQGLSISGVQQKYSLVYDQDYGKIIMRNQDGQFILKPEITDPRFSHGAFSPENEHISMRLTARMKINTALSCLIPLGGHDLGYVTKRFDYYDSERKLLKEDFGQILAIDATGNGKYHPTVEEMGRALDFRSGASLALKAELFRRVVANFILCNGDAHVKNYALIQVHPKSETRVFSPVYDVMNTLVHIPNDNQSALGLTDDNRDQKAGLAKENFDELANRLGLNIKVRNNTYSNFVDSMAGYDSTLMRDTPGLNEDTNKEIRKSFMTLIDDRISIIKHQS